MARSGSRVPESSIPVVRPVKRRLAALVGHLKADQLRQVGPQGSAMRHSHREPTVPQYGHCDPQQSQPLLDPREKFGIEAIGLGRGAIQETNQWYLALCQQAKGNAAVAPPTIVMNSRRLIEPPRKRPIKV